MHEQEARARHWHKRYQEQATWTEALRRYYTARLKLKPDAHLLEVGCGTGAITRWLGDYTQTNVYGLDIDWAYLKLAHLQDPQTRFTAGNGLKLPYAANSFEAVFCHYFLLWVSHAETALAEMVRVCHRGGVVLAFAEPDYGGRVDYPQKMAALGQLQTEAIQRQGADAFMGRKLSELFHAVGLDQVETGVLGGQWSQPPTNQAWQSEWDTLEADLEGMLSKEQIEALRAVDAEAWQTGKRVLYVPTFYAFGVKKE